MIEEVHVTGENFSSGENLHSGITIHRVASVGLKKRLIANAEVWTLLPRPLGPPQFQVGHAQWVHADGLGRNGNQRSSEGPAARSRSGPGRAWRRTDSDGGRPASSVRVRPRLVYIDRAARLEPGSGRRVAGVIDRRPTRPADDAPPANVAGTTTNSLR